MMINKRLINEVPQAKQYIKKQVFMQWQGLLVNVLLIFSMAYLFDSAWNQTLELTHLAYASIVIALLIILRMFLSKKAVLYSYLASIDVKDTLRTRLYRKLLELKNDYTSHVSTSEVVQLSVEGIDQLETYFGKYLPQFFYSVLAPFTLFFILVWIEWKSALVLLLCVPLIPISIIAIQKFAKKLLAKYWGAYTTLGDSFLENLQGLTTFKIYQADEYKNEEMNKEAEHFRNITMKVLTMQLNSVSVMDIVAYGGAAVGCIVAVTSFLNGNVSLGGALAIVLLSSEFFIPLRLLGSFFHIAMNGMAASDKIFRILDIEKNTNHDGVLNDGPISINMKDVSYAYDESRHVLQHINMNIDTNDFIAIVGESGCGKSTCAKLMMGMMKNYTGKVMFNDLDRKDIDDTSFWKRVTYITHNATIFKGTVRDNLAMGNATASNQQMEAALKKVKLYEFIKELGGLDAELKEGGSNFSGGQRQRLSIARALLKDSAMYVFDEATSNIDIESEEAILGVIQELSKQKTIVLITHRLSTVQDCSKIYVMDKGTIMEHGTHEELMKMERQYYRMLQKQNVLESYYGGEQYA